MMSNGSDPISAPPEKGLRQLSEVSNSFWLGTDQNVAPTSEKLIHYTSLSTLYSILENQTLRHTSLGSMNDPREWHFGYEIVRSVVAEYARNCSRLEQQYLHLWTVPDTQRHWPFVFCLCDGKEKEENNGTLNQWRLYGSNGLGVALVLDYPKSTSPVRNKINSKISRPFRVIYDESDATSFVKARLDRYFDVLRSLDKNSYSISDVHLTLFQLLNVLPVVFKDPAYKDEREVRTMVFHQPHEPDSAGGKMVFSESGRIGIRRPHLDIGFLNREKKPNQFHESNLSRIIIGPSGDQEVIADSILNFATHNGFNVEIIKSDISYRAL